MLNREGVGLNGRYGGVGRLSNFGRSLDSGESRGEGGAPEGLGAPRQRSLAQIVHILGRRREPLDEKPREAAGRVAFSLLACLQNREGEHMLY